jgi:hypothetical protein
LANKDCVTSDLLVLPGINNILACSNVEQPTEQPTLQPTEQPVEQEGGCQGNVVAKAPCRIPSLLVADLSYQAKIDSPNYGGQFNSSINDNPLNGGIYFSSTAGVLGGGGCNTPANFPVVSVSGYRRLNGNISGNPLQPTSFMEFIEISANFIRFHNGTCGWKLNTGRMAYAIPVGSGYQYGQAYIRDIDVQMTCGQGSAVAVVTGTLVAPPIGIGYPWIDYPFPQPFPGFPWYDGSGSVLGGGPSSAGCPINVLTGNFQLTVSAI